MRGLPRILSHFRNEFNKFNKTRARRFYLSYDIKITLKSHFCRKNFIILSLCTQRCYGRHNVSRKSINRFYCMVLFHSQTRRHMKEALYTTKIGKIRRLFNGQLHSESDLFYEILLEDGTVKKLRRLKFSEQQQPLCDMN